MITQLIPILMLAGAGMAVWVWRLRVALHPGDAIEAPTLDISIIVPARDEAHNLPALLDSLANLEPAPREVIVVDDHSSDGTGDIARAAGATVVVPPPLPDGWNGKPWACRTGAAEARGAYLLFTDADTTHAPDSLVRVSAEQQRTDAALVSVIPTHILVRFWEHLQGVFHLLLLIATGAGKTTAQGERRFTIGQYILISRATYDSIGGHQVVAQRIAEDLGMGKAVAEAGGRVSTLFAPGLLMVRMYPRGLRAFLAGWRRSFYEGMSSAGAMASLEIAAVMAWLLGAPLLLLRSMASVAVPGTAAGLILYLLGAIAIARTQRWLGAFSPWSALLYPVFVVLFCLVSGLALLDRLLGANVTWKGRRLVSRRRGSSH